MSEGASNAPSKAAGPPAREDVPPEAPPFMLDIITKVAEEVRHNWEKTGMKVMPTKEAPPVRGDNGSMFSMPEGDVEAREARKSILEPFGSVGGARARDLADQGEAWEAPGPGPMNNGRPEGECNTRHVPSRRQVLDQGRRTTDATRASERGKAEGGRKEQGGTPTRDPDGG